MVVRLWFGTWLSLLAVSMLLVVIHCAPLSYHSGSVNHSNSMDKNNTDPEYGDDIEGDMIFRGDPRTSVLRPGSRWDNAVLVYQIKGNFDPEDLEILKQAMAIISNRTCIRFRKRREEKDYLAIDNKQRGCRSSVGKFGGEQLLNLGKKCFIVGKVIHELNHALGMLHEHTRPDRDDYVKINWDNINKTKTANFKVRSWETTRVYGEPYDYDSVMHYSSLAFAMNLSVQTIITNSSIKIGQRKRLSEIDARKLNKMYNCNYWTSPGDGLGSWETMPSRLPPPLQPIQSQSDTSTSTSPTNSMDPTDTTTLNPDSDDEICEDE